LACCCLHPVCMRIWSKSSRKHNQYVTTVKYAVKPVFT
jgi:hypothetical protein